MGSAPKDSRPNGALSVPPHTLGVSGTRNVAREPLGKVLWNVARLRFVLATLLLLPGVALALEGGGYDLSHNAVAGGGATFSIGGGYALGGTIGQAAAGTLTGGPFAVHGGFWVAPPPVATPTATATSTATRTAAPPTPTTTASIAPSATTTRSATPTSSVPAVTGTPTRTPTALASPSGTTTVSPTPSPTPTPDSATPPPAACAGDCNADGAVTVDELIKGVNIALGLAAVDTCAAMDTDADGTVAVNELIAAVNRALSGCSRAADDSPSLSGHRPCPSPCLRASV